MQWKHLGEWLQRILGWLKHQRKAKEEAMKMKWSVVVRTLSGILSFVFLFFFFSCSLKNTRAHIHLSLFSLTKVIYVHYLWINAAAAAKSLQSCPTLCDPTDGSSPDSPIPGILQARTLEGVVISFSSAWKWKVKVKLLSRVQFFATPWTAAHQAPASMGFSRQEYWSGVPLPSPRCLV